ncbi:MAG: 2Fe-2S iron-sulfur cluster-binding protein [Bacteroidota bacterium]
MTPIRSMIGHVLEQKPRSSVTLIYGNRDQENIIFARYFEELAQHPRFELIHCLNEPPANWQGETGLLTQEKCLDLFQRIITQPATLKQSYARDFQFYLCGPGIMMENAISALKTLSVPTENIHQEYFKAAPATPQVVTEEASSSLRLLLPEGPKEVPCGPEVTLLDAALQHGVELPHSCKIGICGSCKHKLVKGDVRRGNDFLLTEVEKSEGYVLTCQAFAKGSELTLACGGEEMEAVPTPQRSKVRIRAMLVGVVLSAVLWVAFTNPVQKSMLAVGPMNTGHEELECTSCHSPAKGNLMQQINANLTYLVGNRKHPVTFGTEDVDNKKCQSCHERPNDRHPVYRFQEPRFVDARKKLGVEKCESCHREHNGVRLVLADLGYCSSCHQDTELNDDPLDVSHKTLIAQNNWQSCLQCHDFHGNHIMETATQMKDTIPFGEIKAYALGGADPYGNQKEYLAEEAIEEIRTMLK